MTILHMPIHTTSKGQFATKKACQAHVDVVVAKLKSGVVIATGGLQDTETKRTPRCNTTFPPSAERDAAPKYRRWITDSSASASKRQRLKFAAAMTDVPQMLGGTGSTGTRPFFMSSPSSPSASDSSSSSSSPYSSSSDSEGAADSEYDGHRGMNHGHGCARDFFNHAEKKLLKERINVLNNEQVRVHTY